MTFKVITCRYVLIAMSLLGVKAPDRRLPEKPFPYTGHHLEEEVAPFEVLLLN